MKDWMDGRLQWMRVRFKSPRQWFDMMGEDMVDHDEHEPSQDLPFEDMLLQ
jgi:hypothetical protein